MAKAIEEGCREMEKGEGNLRRGVGKRKILEKSVNELKKKLEK